MTSKSPCYLELCISGAFAAEGLEPRKDAWCWLCPLVGHRQGWLSQSCAIPEFIKQRPDKAELNWGWGVQLLRWEPGSVCSLPLQTGRCVTHEPKGQAEAILFGSQEFCLFICVCVRERVCFLLPFSPYFNLSFSAGDLPKENPYEDVDLKSRRAGRKSQQLSENSLDSLHRMWSPQDRKYNNPPTQVTAARFGPAGLPAGHCGGLAYQGVGQLPLGLFPSLVLGKGGDLSQERALQSGTCGMAKSLGTIKTCSLGHPVQLSSFPYWSSELPDQGRSPCSLLLSLFPLLWETGRQGPGWILVFLQHWQK